MFIPLDGESPLTDQIYRHVSRAILQGELAPGTRLPSSRQLAQELGVSRNTVLGAFERLAVEGFVEGRGAAGTFVARKIPALELPAEPREAGPSTGSPPDTRRISEYGRRVREHATLFHPLDGDPRAGIRYNFSHFRTLMDRTSVRAWIRLLQREANRLESADWERSPRSAVSPLQVALADYFRRMRGVVAAPEQVILTTSSQQAYQLTAKLFLDAGDKALLEEPHYIGVRNSFRSAGARIFTVPVDGEGMQVERIPREAEGAKLVYAVPSEQWPTGVTLSRHRRSRLLEWAADQGAVVIEDDFNCEFQHEGSPVQSLQGISASASVVYSGTLTRLLAPDHWIGYLIVPPHLVDSYRALGTLEHFCPPAFQHRVLARFVAEGHLERLVRRVRRRTEMARRCLDESLRTHLASEMEIMPFASGFTTYGRLRYVPPSRADELVQAAAREGVGIYPDLPFYLRPPDRLGLVFSIGELSRAEIAEGTRIFGRILRTFRSG